MECCFAQDLVGFVTYSLISFSLSNGLLGFLDVFESRNGQRNVSQQWFEREAEFPREGLTVGVLLRHFEGLIIGVVISNNNNFSRSIELTDHPFH